VKKNLRVDRILRLSTVCSPVVVADSVVFSH